MGVGVGSSGLRGRGLQLHGENALPSRLHACVPACRGLGHAQEMTLPGKHTRAGAGGGGCKEDGEYVRRGHLQFVKPLPSIIQDWTPRLPAGHGHTLALPGMQTTGNGAPVSAKLGAKVAFVGSAVGVSVLVHLQGS